MRKLPAGLAGLALLSMPAFAAETSQPKSAKDPDKVVCKVDRSTGSSISERVCKKRSVWEAERESARRHLDQDRRMNSSPDLLSPNKGGG